MRHSTQSIQVDTDGLTKKCRPELARLGQRRTGVVINASGLKVAADSSGLLFFPLSQVFTAPSAFIGFGSPNTYLVTPTTDGAGTRKLAAFMFWRSKSAVVPTKGRVQSGVLYELRDLPQEAVRRLNACMEAAAGTRSASCAHQVALVLHQAGFRLGGGASLQRVYRPSRFASLLWRHGLSYTDTNGTVVQTRLRVIHASPKDFGEHFVGVWQREISSPLRLAKKQYAKHAPHMPAPLFAPEILPELRPDQWNGPTVTVGLAKSNRFGANAAFVVGQKPVYIVQLPDIGSVPALHAPLKPFPVVDDFVTRLKRYVLFSRPVITAINRVRLAGVDWYTDGLKADMVVDMLKLSPGCEYKDAVLYNCVVTQSEIRVTGLHSKDERSQRSKLIRTLNWVAAKHAMLSSYDPTVVFACELWVYRDGQERPVLCINCNSGTYRPTPERMRAFAQYLRETFKVQVRVSDD